MLTFSPLRSVSYFSPTIPSINQPIPILIIQKVKPGFESVFQEALCDFISALFSQSCVQHTSMLVSPSGAFTPEFGILRTYENEQERDAFHQSLIFKAWEERIKPMIEGEPLNRQLNGFEAWFCGQPISPPRWKMAVLIIFNFLNRSIFREAAVAEVTPPLLRICRYF